MFIPKIKQFKLSKEMQEQARAVAEITKAKDQLVQAEVAAAFSTADAVRAVLEGDAPEAAIGTARAAEIYGGAILAEDIADAEEKFGAFETGLSPLQEGRCHSRMPSRWMFLISAGLLAWSGCSKSSCQNAIGDRAMPVSTNGSELISTARPDYQANPSHR